MIRATVAVAIGLMIASATYAADLQTDLIGPRSPVTAGQPTELTVIWTNPTDRTQPVRIREFLECLIDSADATHAARATAVAPETAAVTQIMPDGFIKRHYRLPIPASLSGWVNLECRLEDTHRLSFQVDDPGERPQTAADKPLTSEEAEEKRVLETLQSRFQMFAAKLTFYEPLYFLVGTDPEESKFQLSFKYRFFNTEAYLVKNYPWVAGFHLAYTQTSFWDLKSASEPFRDTSYKPELFFLSPTLDVDIPRLYLFRIQTGFQHESNGRGGEESRSTNFLYLKPVLIFGKGTPYALEIAPKFWIYVGNDDQTNPDLKDYRGYFDFELKFGRARSLSLTTHYTYAREGSSFQADFTYPLSRLLGGNLDLYFQAQYFNGYAESLLRYTEKTEALRLGIAIVR
jgi:outer membrane phospholipase A